MNIQTMTHPLYTSCTMRARSRLAASVAVLLATCLGMSGAQAAEPYYESIVYPDPGVFFTSATGINARGDIVGQYRAPGVIGGFRYDMQGDFHPIAYPGALSTEAFGINSAGDVAGSFRMAPNGPFSGFVLRDDQWTVIDCTADLGATHTFAFGVNGAGDVVGEYKLPGGVLGQPGRAFLYSDGTCQDITPPDAGAGTQVAVAWTLNDAGDAGGYFVSATGTHGWVRDRHGNYETIDVPGGIFTNVRGINDAGEVAGVYRTGGPNLGFVRDAGGNYAQIGYPGAALNRALGINARGDVVGDYGGSDCMIARCAWVWRR